MEESTSYFTSDDGVEIHTYKWYSVQEEYSNNNSVPCGTVHIVHGMSEHAGRYRRLAEVLVQEGFEVYAHDHRGHGKTAKTAEDLGHSLDEDGWNRLVHDLGLLVKKEKREGVPYIIIGHSLGSFVTQQFLYTYPGLVDAVILSGSDGKPPALAYAAKFVGWAEKLRQGKRGRSSVINAAAFGSFNKAFKVNGVTRTAFDWLSRDEKEVDKYVADPLCGFICTNQFWIDFMAGRFEMANPCNHALIKPKDLPIFIIAGDKDPVSNNAAGLKQLINAYKTAGLINVEYKFYQDARHEVFNEINREEVFADVLAFLKRVINNNKNNNNNNGNGNDNDSNNDKRSGNDRQ